VDRVETYSQEKATKNDELENTVKIKDKVIYSLEKENEALKSQFDKNSYDTFIEIKQ
jgi:hypothetical protein